MARKLNWSSFALPLLLLLLPSVVAAQTSDTTPPTLVSFDFNPKNIDVTASAQTITVTARITDNLSGAPYGVFVAFKSANGQQAQNGFINWVSGSNLDVTLSGQITIPKFVLSGTWRPEFSIGDAVGNNAFFNATSLASLGFPVDLTVASNPDSTPPAVASAVFTPSLIDVSASDQAISLDLRLTDNVSGVDLDGFPNYYVAYLNSPSSNRYAIPYRDFTLVSGSALDGTYRLNWTIPRFSEAGIWKLSLIVTDVAGNYLNTSQAGSFTVASSTPDLAPPALTALAFSPAVIDTSAGPANVTVTMRLTDNVSGVDFAFESLYGGWFKGLTFRSPSGSQFRSACCNQFSRIQGTVLDGVWQASIFFPQYSEAGTWKAQITATDRVKNFLNLNAGQIAAANLPTDLVVVRPSLVGDGSVGAGGGTVNDSTFGTRASITFPAGAVGSLTDIAIDVFPDPLAVPTPQGFQGPGTFFVNIKLTPEPTYPFAPPGVTVTLPLPQPLNPGTAIPLFFVNTTTGALEPMPNVSTGLQVVGTVNPGGLSATFTGISHFSILVGLIPNVIQVGLDIKPGSSENPINTKSNGKTPVAILSSRTFNAVMAVDRATLTFGRTGDERSLAFCNPNGEDVNGDGLRDLMCHFNTPATGFRLGDTVGVLKGRTLSYEKILGTDSVRVVH